MSRPGAFVCLALEDGVHDLTLYKLFFDNYRLCFGRRGSELVLDEW